MADESNKSLAVKQNFNAPVSEPILEREGYLHLSINPEERLRLIEENVQDYAIFVVDPEGRIASWNVGAQRILGYTEAEVIGMNCAEIFTEEDRLQGAVERERSTATETGRAEDERWHKRKNGTLFWGSGIMTGLRDPAGKLRGFVKILRDRTDQKKAEVQRQENLEHLAELDRQATILEERNRISRELHDTLAQGFTGISIQIEAAEDVFQHAPDQTAAHLRRASHLARHYLAESRRSVLALRPQALVNNDLPAALAQSVQQITDGTALVAAFEMEGAVIPLPHDVENDLLRIGQEALTNALKHAQASQIEIRLIFRADEVQLEIIDNGHGFDIVSLKNPINNRNASSGTFGILGMRERVERMQGQIQFFSAADQGTRIVVTVPIRNNFDTISANSQNLYNELM